MSDAEKMADVKSLRPLIVRFLSDKKYTDFMLISDISHFNISVERKVSIAYFAGAYIASHDPNFPEDCRMGVPRVRTHE